MKKTVFYMRFFLLALCVALFAAIQARGSDAKEEQSDGRGLTPAPTEWRELFADDKGYHDEYDKIQAKEETFSGTLTYEEEKNPSTLMRWMPFKLDGVGVYVGSQDLKEYVGKKVEIVGKKNSFALEGQVVTEIWPLKIRVAAAQEEQPKAVEHKEIPAKAVNGLLFEIKLLNTRPLLPGDALEVEYRMTNMQDIENIRLIDIGIVPWGHSFISAKIMDSDGKPFPLPETKHALAVPPSPTCTLQPGCFYGRKQQIPLPQSLKPGKYTLTLHYNNGFDLKDKGSNCWTGKAESNTIVFEVTGADVKPVNGIQMFVRMKKETYTENEPVMVEARLYNAGDKEQEVYVPDDFLLNYYSQGTVTDEGGKVIEWRIREAERVSAEKYEKLLPGAVFVKEYDLRSVCTLPPGKYTFRLETSIPWVAQNDMPGPCISNEVHFEVVKAEKTENP